MNAIGYQNMYPLLVCQNQVGGGLNAPPLVEVQKVVDTDDYLTLHYRVPVQLRVHMTNFWFLGF
jgi:hypothetical protein